MQSYSAIFYGLRSYYAGNETDNMDAAFSAVVLLSALMTLNLIDMIIIADVIAFQDVRTASWLLDHKWTFALLLGCVLAFHHLLARRWGVYERRGLALTDSWRPAMRAYLVGTTVLLVASMFAAYWSRT